MGTLFKFSVGLLVALSLTGCIKPRPIYTVTFELADVINAWGDDRTTEQLAVDVVALTEQQAGNHAEMVNGTLKSDEWFRMRDSADPRIADIPPEQILALRRGVRDKRDHHSGDTFVSPAMAGPHQQRNVPVSFVHPDFGNPHAAIVIYGRFTARDGLAKTDPVVFRPPRAFQKKKPFRVKIERSAMSTSIGSPESG